MNTPSWLAGLAHFVHRFFLWLLIGAYALAAWCPAAGLWLRRISLGEISLGHESLHLSPSMLMLALLLFNAGLGMQTSQLRNLLQSPVALLAGLAANVLVPVTFIWIVAQTMRLWHNAEEVQFILIGLALVAAMPIAGSSTAWSQNANGDLALSLALVLFSTFLSPLTTPLTFDIVEHMATGEFARRTLDDLESNGTDTFLVMCVLLPSVLGIVVRSILGERRIAEVKPALKVANYGNLLLLNYSNAAISLPQVLAQPDWDFLTAIVIIVVVLCGCTFGGGWLLGRLLKVNSPRHIALIFGLGMNNNGTGLVLASLVLPHFPQVMLPIIFYNLVQHLVAGGVDHFLLGAESV